MWVLPPNSFHWVFRVSLGAFNQSVFGLISTSVRFSFDLWFFINPASFTGFGFLSEAFLLHISWTSTSVEFGISFFCVRSRLVASNAANYIKSHLIAGNHIEHCDRVRLLWKANCFGLKVQPDS